MKAFATFHILLLPVVASDIASDGKDVSCTAAWGETNSLLQSKVTRTHVADDQKAFSPDKEDETSEKKLADEDKEADEDQSRKQEDEDESHDEEMPPLKIAGNTHPQRSDDTSEEDQSRKQEDEDDSRDEDISPLKIVGNTHPWGNDNGNKEDANEASSTANTFASTMVSYVYGGSVINAMVERELFSNGDKSIDICDDNLDVFLKRGYSPNSDIDFFFTVLHGREEPKQLQELARASANVFIRRATWDCGVDLCQHQYVADNERQKKNYSEFIFVNCGARGPYGYAQGPGETNGSIWYRNLRSMLTTYDAVGPTISGQPQPGFHLQSYMIALSSRSIHVIDTLWHKRDLSKELVFMQLQQLNVSPRLLRIVINFFRSCCKGKKCTPADKFLRIALGELGLSFVLLSAGKKLQSMCFDARTLRSTSNPTACFKNLVAPKCKDPTATNVSSTDCTKCPQLEPNHCKFVKFGGDIVRQGLLSPWTYARVAEYDLRDLGYRLRFRI